MQIMKKHCGKFAVFVAATLLSAPFAPSLRAENTAITPAPREAKWMQRHEGFLAETKRGNIDLLFLGDSITDGWRSKGKAVWEKFWTPLHAANFGISGDRTQHVLWRMQNGEIAGIKPKLVVLMIGTNNTGKEKADGKARNTTAEVIQGVTAVVQGLRANLPPQIRLLDASHWDIGGFRFLIGFQPDLDSLSSGCLGVLAGLIYSFTDHTGSTRGCVNGGIASHIG